MKTIQSEQILCCDIDSTLLIWGASIDQKRVKFFDPYEKITKHPAPHRANIKILNDRLSRGATVLVWSASGYQWAVEALKALDIKHKNIIICSKPVGYIDDKPCQDWMGPQIYLNPTDDWGK